METIAKLLIEFDEVVESLPRHNQGLGEIDDWPTPSKNANSGVPALDKESQGVFAVGVHEAAHLAAEVFFGGRAECVTISPSGTLLGFVAGHLRGNSIDAARERMVTAFAGPVATAYGFPNTDDFGSDDYENAYRQARLIHGKLGKSKRIRREVQNAERRARKVVEHLWNSIIRIGVSLATFQNTAIKIPKFDKPLESLDEKVITPIIPFQTGEPKDETTRKIQNEA